MFKYLKFYFFIVFLILNNHSHAVSEVSDLKLSNNSINEFFNYISSPRKNADRLVSLPIHPFMTPEDCLKVVKILNSWKSEKKAVEQLAHRAERV